MKGELKELSPYKTDLVQTPKWQEKNDKSANVNSGETARDEDERQMVQRSAKIVNLGVQLGALETLALVGY